MSREIKFRGLSKDTGKWVYGYYFVQNENHYIYRCLAYIDQRVKHWAIEVIPETVGQFTGLLDKNGKEIWEGDIVSDKTPETNWWDGVITWHEGGSVGWVAEPLPENKCRGAWGLNYNYILEIIGNIHQNPELLKSK